MKIRPSNRTSPSKVTLIELDRSLARFIMNTPTNANPTVPTMLRIRVRVSVL